MVLDRQIGKSPHFPPSHPGHNLCAPIFTADVERPEAAYLLVTFPTKELNAPGD
jgi:hypothetical protein